MLVDWSPFYFSNSRQAKDEVDLFHSIIGNSIPSREVVGGNSNVSIPFQDFPLE
jgi:hypothetical protein